jgi:poly(3-hydroxybutyrate) depolymerase
LGRRALAITACAAALLPAFRVSAADDAAQGSRAMSLEVDGRSRTFRLFVPPSAPAINAPLVVVLHGGYGTGQMPPAAAASWLRIPTGSDGRGTPARAAASRNGRTSTTSRF